MSGDEKLSDVGAQGAEPVITPSENAGDSESVASGITERATGDGEAFETRTSSMATTPSVESAMPVNNVTKKPVPSERSESGEKGKGGYGLLVISGLVLVIGGIVGALVQFSKKKKNTL